VTPSAEYKKPVPRITRVNQPYWDAARNHELRLQRCTDCRHVWFPPSELCPRCLGQSFEWDRMSGRGKLWSWITMWQQYYPAFAADLPYTIAYVELEQGPRLMMTLIDCDPAQLRCDMPVEVVFDDVTENLTLPRARPVAG
jgi:uncharacterized protein